MYWKSDKPLLMAMVQEATAEGAIDLIEKALGDGAEAFGIQLESLEEQYRNLETLRTIFTACQGKPIHITSYRLANSKGFTDEQCMELLLLGCQAGATLCDIMADTFDPQPHELTFDETAIQKQMALIEKIHSMGAQVLLSTHTHAYLDKETILQYALEQKRRGADVVKIVNFARNRQELEDNMEMVFSLRKALGETPFLFLANKAGCVPLRQLGPVFGVCMYLCVYERRPGYSTEQPILKEMKALRDSLAFPAE